VKQIGDLSDLKERIRKESRGKGKDSSDSSSPDVSGTSEVPQEAPEQLFLDDDTESGSERETQLLLGRETSDDEDTVVPSEQPEDDNVPKRRPVPTPGGL
jgi:hypothetical protein